jgi:hypothetical protein
MAKGNAILLAFGKGKGEGASKDDDSEPDMDDDDESAEASKEEAAAFSEFKAALNGGDDAEGALALKNFISVCKGY